MGYDATNHLPPGTKIKDVGEFLQLLGFEKGGPGHGGGLHWVTYWHYDPDDYERFQGLSADVYADGDEICVDTRTLISRNQADCDLHNSTIRHLRKRFGGHFCSDYGRNRYFPSEGRALRGAEAGCYLAYWRFQNNMGRVHIYLMRRCIDQQPYDKIMKDLDPIIISNNMLVPLLVSLIEDFLKSVYRALLRFSDRKGAILRGVRLSADDLLSAGFDSVRVEDAVTRTMAFQNLKKVHEYFKGFKPSIDFAGSLKRPYRRRKMSLYQSVNELIMTRHDFIHRATMDTTLTDKRMERIVNDVKAAMRRFYEHLIDKNGWHTNDQD